eukprot:902580-Amphidinium_carterae.4
MQLDLADAFNSINRQSALTALAQVDVELAASQRSWLCHNSYALFRHSSGAVELLPSNNGIPQGDPFSSLCFCLTLAYVHAQFMAETTRILPPATSWRWRAYVDDVILRAPPAHAGTILSCWEAALGAHDPALRALWEDGLTLVGQPLEYAKSDAPQDMAIPTGTDKYVQDFLAERLLDFQKRLCVAECLPNVLRETGAHIARHVIRLCLLSKHIHLLRALEPALTSAWCHQLDGAVEDSFKLPSSRIYPSPPH